MLSLVFSVGGNAVGKQRPKVYTAKDGSKRAVTPKKTRNYEALVKYEAQHAIEYMVKKPDFSAPCEASIDVYYPVPKSYSKKQRRQIAESGAWVVRPGKPDLDNVIKSILDGMNGIVYRDDVQVVSLRAKKHWCEGEELPRVDVKVEWGD